jgi:hypothetical protein
MRSQRLLLASVFVVGLTSIASAQRPSGAGAPAAHPQPAANANPKVTNHTSGPQSGAKGEPKSFNGVAKQLGTTPEALDQAYKAASQANPKLTRGQFIAANMVSKNLSDKYPSVTVQALLDGLAGGKSIGQSLHGLGVPSDEANKAESDADHAAGSPPAGKGKNKGD